MSTERTSPEAALFRERTSRMAQAEYDRVLHELETLSETDRAQLEQEMTEWRQLLDEEAKRGEEILYPLLLRVCWGQLEEIHRLRMELRIERQRYDDTKKRHTRKMKRRRKGLV